MAKAPTEKEIKDAIATVKRALLTPEQRMEKEAKRVAELWPDPPTVYHYGDNGYLLGAEFADISPLEPGKYIDPAKTTRVAPPEFGSGQVPVWDEENSKWAVINIPEDGPLPADPVHDDGPPLPGIPLTSPDGSVWYMKVDDKGKMSVTKA